MGPSSLLFCDTCGAANQPRAFYCRACGHSLQGIQSPLYHSATGHLLTTMLLKQHYRIIAPIAKGGMGAVYKAEDTQLGNRLVAIKEMSQSGLSPQEIQEAANAFKQEAILLANLQHPHLPSIFDHFEDNGRWYLVMSFIEGETLTHYLGRKKTGNLPLDEALSIALQLCEVLCYLHTQHPSIIFRDLKPSNVIRTASGHLYLIDFGIARHFKPGQTKDTVYYGTMGYAPPEQFGRAQTTPRSDIYSLGALLYQLISGHDPTASPFRFPPLQSFMPTTPRGLSKLLTQMLELDEAKRPANILIVKQKLQSIAGQAVTPSSPPPVRTAAAPNSNPPVPPTPSHLVQKTPLPKPAQPRVPRPAATPTPSSTNQFGPSKSSIMLNQPPRIPSRSSNSMPKPVQSRAPRPIATLNPSSTNQFGPSKSSIMLNQQKSQN
ncbi:hypothetical protein KSF_076460 [Reticulibacter mediterranei]|uniref:non-specific serine/threonine protein kinase n=1 Tax=Reticulibacter mediterranei TaxID=2778369 RepID=A0A8J3N6I6_9CHLR|nr:serine/threonine-protein kinase [Reticulibacter mediterranei]GHO97598.1 hypothetical protein KSF_076460 [Reticulibacter mediterranei]